MWGLRREKTMTMVVDDTLWQGWLLRRTDALPREKFERRYAMLNNQQLVFLGKPPAPDDVVTEGIRGCQDCYQLKRVLGVIKLSMFPRVEPSPDVHVANMPFALNLLDANNAVCEVLVTLDQRARTRDMLVDLLRSLCEPAHAQRRESMDVLLAKAKRMSHHDNQQAKQQPKRPRSKQTKPNAPSPTAQTQSEDGEEDDSYPRTPSTVFKLARNTSTQTQLENEARGDTVEALTAQLDALPSKEFEVVRVDVTGKLSVRALVVSGRFVQRLGRRSNGDKVYRMSQEITVQRTVELGEIVSVDSEKGLEGALDQVHITAVVKPSGILNRMHNVTIGEKQLRHRVFTYWCQNASALADEIELRLGLYRMICQMRNEPSVGEQVACMERTHSQHSSTGSAVSSHRGSIVGALRHNPGSGSSLEDTTPSPRSVTDIIFDAQTQLKTEGPVQQAMRNFALALNQVADEDLVAETRIFVDYLVSHLSKGPSDGEEEPEQGEQEEDGHDVFDLEEEETQNLMVEALYNPTIEALLPHIGLKLWDALCGAHAQEDEAFRRHQSLPEVRQPQGDFALGDCVDWMACARQLNAMDQTNVPSDKVDIISGTVKRMLQMLSEAVDQRADP